MWYVLENIRDLIVEERQKKYFRISFPPDIMIREKTGAEFRPTKPGEQFIVKRADWMDMTTGVMASGDFFKALGRPLSVTQNLPATRV